MVKNMLADCTKIENKIKSLIYQGRIKNEEDLINVPINSLYKMYGICVKDLICYSCYKSNGVTCKYGCNPE